MAEESPNRQDGQRKSANKTVPMLRLKPMVITKVFLSTGNGLNDMEPLRKNITPVQKPQEKLLRRSPLKAIGLPVLKLKKEELKSRLMHNINFQKI